MARWHRLREGHAVNRVLLMVLVVWISINLLRVLRIPLVLRMRERCLAIKVSWMLWWGLAIRRWLVGLMSDRLRLQLESFLRRLFSLSRYRYINHMSLGSRVQLCLLEFSVSHVLFIIVFIL